MRLSRPGPRPRRPVFTGTPEQYRHLCESWGADAAKCMVNGEPDRAFYSAELAARFAFKGNLVERMDAAPSGKE